jgi:hypothetical protein
MQRYSKRLPLVLSADAIKNQLLAGFPVIMEKEKPKAAVVDVKALRQLQVTLVICCIEKRSRKTL